MKLLALALLASAPCFANTCTLTGGVYATLAASATHWTGTGCTTTVPGSGDSATLAGNASLTIASGEIWTVGSFPADHTGTPAIQAADGSVLNEAVGATIIYQGPIIKGNSIWTFSGITKCDASGAATPATALYQVETANGNNQSSANLVITGTSGARAVWTSNSPAAYHCGIIGSDTVQWAGSGRVQASYVDFSYIGTASVPAFQFNASASPAGQHYTWDHCTFDHTGQLVSDRWDGSEVFDFSNNTVTNPLTSPALWLIFGSSAITTGSRTINNNFFHAPGIGVFTMISASAGTGVQSGLVANNNVVQGQTAMALRAADFSGNYLSTSYDGLIGHVMPSAPSFRLNYGRDASATHTHLDMGEVDACGSGCTSAITDSVFEQFASNATQAGGDGSLMILGLAIAGTFNATGNIVLPSPTYLYATGAIFNADTHGAPLWTITADRNTYTSDAGSNNSAINGESDPGATGQFTSVQHNIAWLNTVGEGSIIHPFQDGNSLIAPGTFTTARNNWMWNIQKYTGTNYSVIGYDQIDAAFTTQQGVGDVVGVNPQFADKTRSVETFWGAYLGNSPSRGAWDIANSYAIGDTVSDVMPSGITTYWRAIATIGANTANSEPALGSHPWTTLWEPAAEQTMGLSVVSGAVFSDASIGCSNDSITTCMVKWVRAGFAPTNPAACGYGAVDCAPPSTGSAFVCLFYGPQKRPAVSVLGACPFVY